MRVLVLQSGIVGQRVSAFLMKEFSGDEYVFVSIKQSVLEPRSLSDNSLEVVARGDTGIFSKLEGAFDIGLLAWWPDIIGTPLLDLPKNGFLNIHPSFLPFGRGKDPNFWAIVDDLPFGVTIHRVDARLDHGPVLARTPIEKTWEDTGESLYQRAILGCVDLLQEKWTAIRAAALAGTLSEMETSFPEHGIRSRAELLGASTLRLDDQISVREVLNILRARSFPPHPGACFDSGGETFEVTVTIRKRQ